MTVPATPHLPTDSPSVTTVPTSARDTQIAGATWTELATASAIAAQEADAAANALAPVRVAVKANIAVRGLIRSAASPVLATEPAEADAPVVAALRAHGGVMVGMTNMHELAFGITSQNAHYGAVTTPGLAAFSAGGSSGGSAAAVASGAASLALATDTGGSVSIPSSHCGVVGFRPSTGRWSTAGLVGLSWTRDTPGVMANSVGEIARADTWVTSDASVPGLTPRPKLGIPTEFLTDLTPEVALAFRHLRDRLAPVADCVEVSLAGILERTARAAMTLVGWEAPRLLSAVAAETLHQDPETAYRRLVAGTASADVRGILESLLTNPVPADAYAQALRDTTLARTNAAALHREHGIDALLFPTTPAPAPAVTVGDTTMHNGTELSTFALYTRHTEPGTILGAPMLTLPLPRDAAELQIGVTLQGARGADRALLALGQHLEPAVTTRAA